MSVGALCAYVSTIGVACGELGMRGKDLRIMRFELLN